MAVGFQTWKSTVFELSCIRKKLRVAGSGDYGKKGTDIYNEEIKL